MFEFAWVWSAIALPLPYLMAKLTNIEKFSTLNQQAALKVPFLQDFQTDNAQVLNANNRRQIILPAIIWGLLILAAMRPQWLGEPIEISVNGRDLVLAIDLSGSMEQTDFMINGVKVNRLTAVKHVANDFISRRVGDRLGLILFGTRAYFHPPLTFDRKTVAVFLNESQLRLAGGQTAIGDAIGLAVKRLKQQTANSKVLVLLTDGANTVGVISPITAAKLAAKSKLKIYTIGVGADKMIEDTIFGRQAYNPSQDLDEKTLTEIANITGGKYFRARDSQALTEIYKILDVIEPIKKDLQFFNPVAELFYYPLILSLLLSFLTSWWWQKYHE